MSTLAENPAVSTSTLEADSLALTQTRSKRLNLHFAISLILFHLGAIAAFFFFSWSAVAVFAVLWVLDKTWASA